MTDHNFPGEIKILDSLKELQRIADRIDNPVVKSRRLRQGLQQLSADEPDAQAFKRMTLQVPVSAIDICCSAEVV